MSRKTTRRRARRLPHPGWAVLAMVAVVGVYVAIGVAVIGPAVAESAAPAPGGTSAPGGAATVAPAEAPAIAPAPVPQQLPVAGNAALVDQTWAREQATKTGIPLRALLGYAGAEIALRTENAACRLGWTSLAALGAIESGHGTHGGAKIEGDGVTRPGVWGPDLDGNGNALIRDTDGGAIDGSAAYDRAVGPLQFIPETWRTWGADGNADGVADPQQIDDAALAAGRYLCHYGDLSDPATWRRAIFAYNHLDVYVDDVARTANAYAERSLR
ncbi:lytic transglycosylase domain-containing protein [Microbacterium sp. CJ88]|uniref:lytic transglycosylase domain-containing protein n=1 Tax=Microbacterium sp. CJ88 TaxID=3445672 RepID=UPI003F655379